MSVRRYVCALVLATAVMLLFSIVSGESEGREADNAYYDSDLDTFILEFSSGISGDYSCTVVSESGDTVHVTSYPHYTGQKTIGFKVDEGKEITPGKYHVDMVAAGDHIFQTVTVGFEPQKDDPSEEKDYTWFIIGGGAGVAVVALAVFFFMRR